MADLFKACRNVTWVQGDLGDPLTGWVPPPITDDEVMCAYGATREEAIEALGEKIDDACPWWYTFGLISCYQHAIQVTTEKFDIDHNKWFNRMFKIFS